MFFPFNSLKIQFQIKAYVYLLSSIYHSIMIMIIITNDSDRRVGKERKKYVYKYELIPKK